MMINPFDRSVASAATVNRSTSLNEAAAIDRDDRLLRIRGLTAVEAGNVVAYLNGLPAAECGWTVQEIKHLVAIRSLVTVGVIDS